MEASRTLPNPQLFKWSEICASKQAKSGSPVSYTRAESELPSDSHALSTDDLTAQCVSYQGVFNSPCYDTSCAPAPNASGPDRRWVIKPVLMLVEAVIAIL